MRANTSVPSAGSRGRCEGHGGSLCPATRPLEARRLGCRCENPAGKSQARLDLYENPAVVAGSQEVVLGAGVAGEQVFGRKQRQVLRCSGLFLSY